MKINTISIIISILAIAVAGFTLFRNPDQTPYGATLPFPQEAIAIDSNSEQQLEPIKSLQPYRVYRVFYETASYVSVSQPGLPTYDSLLIPRLGIKNHIQRGAFSSSLFFEKTPLANNIVFLERLR